MWTGEFTCAQRTQLISQVGPHFSTEVGGKARRFPLVMSEHYKQWRYLRNSEPRAAGGRGHGAFSAGNTRLPRGTRQEGCHQVQHGGGGYMGTEGCPSARRLEHRGSPGQLCQGPEYTASATYLRTGSQAAPSLCPVLNKPLLLTHAHTTAKNEKGVAGKLQPQRVAEIS